MKNLLRHRINRNPFVDEIVRVFEGDVFLLDSVKKMVWEDKGNNLLVFLQPPDDSTFHDLQQVVISRLREAAPDVGFVATARKWMVNGRRSMFFKITKKNNNNRSRS